jgi:hypothetical protein
MDFSPLGVGITTIILIESPTASGSPPFSMAKATLKPAVLLVASLLVVGWSAPAPAWASCGDYVSHGASPSNQSAAVRSPLPEPDSTPLRRFPTSAELRGPGAIGLIDREIAPVHSCRQCPSAPRRSPCHGPWCSGSHEPMHMPNTTIAPVIDDWACLWSSAICAAELPGVLSACRDRSSLAHHVFLVYHPPRIIRPEKSQTRID